MTSPRKKLNAGTKAGTAQAEQHLSALTRAYGRSLRAAGRRAAIQMRRTTTVTAAANPEWTPPPVDSLINQDELAADTQRKTARLHRLMLVEAGQAALDPFGLTFDIHAPTSQALLDQIGQRIQDGIAAAIREQIQEAVRDGYTNGKSVAQVSTAIQQATDTISRPRADMLARTDLNALSNGGSLIAATVSGAAATKTWIAANDERTRETHAEADGQTVPIDGVFDVGGESAQYPGDPSLSDEESCNCRCTIGYGEPLTASSDAGEPTTTAVPSGGTMSDMSTDPALDVAAMTEEQRAEFRVLLDAPPDPFVARLAATREHLAANDADIIDREELRAIMLAFEFANGLSKTDVLETPDPVVAAAEGETAWQAILTLEGSPSRDGRLFDPGAFTWPDHELSLLAQLSTDDGHDGAQVCGRIDRIWRSGQLIMGAGVFSSDQFGQQVAELVSNRMLNGVSIDYIPSEFVLRPIDTPDSEGDIDETLDLYDGDGPDAEDLADIAYQNVCIAAEIGAATILALPAFGEAIINVVGNMTAAVDAHFELPGLTAAAAGLVPIEPPAAWFDDPVLSGPTPMTVTDDGRIYGHLATWGTCHTGKPGVCITPPHSPSEYANFHRGELRTDDGSRIAVGVLTMNTGHAGLRVTPAATVSHYDDTGTQGAHVRAGEDPYGIWLAGAINPNLSAADARILMASTPSGDWREVNRGDGLDLFAALAVNVPGFPVPRASARLVASGEEMERVALVAAGVVDKALTPEEFARELAVLAASVDGIEGLAALVAS